MSRVFQKPPEALYDLIKDVLPQSLIHVLRVGKLNVGQDDLLVKLQQVHSRKQNSAFSVRKTVQVATFSKSTTLKAGEH